MEGDAHLWRQLRPEPAARENLDHKRAWWEALEPRRRPLAVAVGTGEATYWRKAARGRPCGGRQPAWGGGMAKERQARWGAVWASGWCTGRGGNYGGDYADKLKPN